MKTGFPCVFGWSPEFLLIIFRCHHISSSSITSAPWVPVTHLQFLFWRHYYVISSRKQFFKFKFSSLMHHYFLKCIGYRMYLEYPTTCEIHLVQMYTGIKKKRTISLHREQAQISGIWLLACACMFIISTSSIIRSMWGVCARNFNFRQLFCLHGCCTAKVDDATSIPGHGPHILLRAKCKEHLCTWI